MFYFIYLWYKCQMLNLFSETSWPLLEIRFVANKPRCTLKEYHPLPRITTFWKGSIVLKPRYLVNAYRKSVDFRKGLLNMKRKTSLIWINRFSVSGIYCPKFWIVHCLNITCRHQKETRNSWIKKCIKYSSNELNLDYFISSDSFIVLLHFIHSP